MSSLSFGSIPVEDVQEPPRSLMTSFNTIRCNIKCDKNAIRYVNTTITMNDIPYMLIDDFIDNLRRIILENDYYPKIDFIKEIGFRQLFLYKSNIIAKVISIHYIRLTSSCYPLYPESDITMSLLLTSTGDFDVEIMENMDTYPFELIKGVTKNYTDSAFGRLMTITNCSLESYILPKITARTMFESPKNFITIIQSIKGNLHNFVNREIDNNIKFVKSISQ